LEKPWTYVFATCFFCDNVFRVRGNSYRQRIKDNKGKIFCGRSCQVKQQRLDLKKLMPGTFQGEKAKLLI